MTSQLRNTFYKNAKLYKTNRLWSEALKSSCQQRYNKPARLASCLIPLLTVEDELNILFIKQAANSLAPGTKKHMAITYPGGKFDDQLDKTTIDTAYRETMEEIPGLKKLSETSNLKISLWDEFSFPNLTSPSADLLVNGYVCEINGYNFDRTEIENLEVNSGEVEKVYAVPVSDCLDADNFKRYSWKPHPGAADLIKFAHDTPGYEFLEGEVRVIGWPGYFLNMMLHCMYPEKHELVFDENFVWFEHPDHESSGLITMK